MKCPFNPNYIQQTIHRPPKHTRIRTKDVDGEPDLLHTLAIDFDIVTTNILRPCIETECASFQNGRCVRI